MNKPTRLKTTFVFEGRDYTFCHVDESDHIFRIIRETGGFYEPDFLESLRPLVAPGELVVDVGANIGNHAVFFARACGCRVVAFEPNPDAAALLRLNAKTNGLDDDIQVLELALGAEPGRGRSALKAEHNLGSAVLEVGEGDVEIARLDDVALPAAPRLLKIDVEGMEREVLAGARGVIDKHRPVICVEATTRGALAGVRALLDPLDYHALEAFNYSPTHIFVPVDARERPAHTLRTVSRLASNLEMLRLHQDREIQRVLDCLRGEIGPAVRDRRASERIEAAVAALDKAVAQRLEAVAAKQAADVSRRFDELGRIASLLESGVAEIASSKAAVAERLSGLASDLSGRLDAAAERVAEHIDALGGHLSTHLNRLAAGAPAAPAGVRASARDEQPPSICFWAVDWGVDLDTDWRGWTTHQAAELEPAGVVVLRQDRSTPGVQSGLIDTAGPGLLEIVLRANFASGGPKPFLRIVAAGSDEILAADTPIQPGETRVRFYQPHRVEKIRILVLVERPQPGFRLQLERIELSKMDEEAHQRWVREKVGAPVIASLASIPSRRAMLEDAVACLLPQCDEVRVYLNGYDDTPAFLSHPRVVVRRSQDFDDNGDAGKFGWVDEDDPPGYRIVCDDDLLFPPDLVERLTAKVAKTGNRAIVGLHGVLLRQPFTEYYASQSRRAIHFASALERPKLVQILATCVMCAHSSALGMRRRDFLFRNMADVWLAKHAQENDIPLMIVDRPFRWVRQNSQPGGFETIYDSSRNRTRSAFDSSYIQDATLKAIAPLSIRKLDADVCLMAVAARSKAELERFLARFDATIDPADDWILVVVVAADDAALRAHVRAMPFTHELHVVDPADWSAHAAGAALCALLGELRYDRGFFADAGVSFENADWRRLPAEEGWLEEAAFLGFDVGDVVEACPPAQSWPSFAIFRRDVFAQPGEGAWRVPLSATAMQRARTAERALTPCLRRADGGPCRVALTAPAAPARKPPRRINDVFERVVVLNLDRREDRWAAARRRLGAAGIEATRVRAVDGRWTEVAAEYREYAASPLRRIGPDIPPLQSMTDFYLRPASQAQRTAFLEARTGRKAIATPGAWGYLKSMIAVLERAIADGVESLLVLDDDVVFHKRAGAIFAEAVRELPNDWRILQLGTLQYDWDSRWIRWRSPHLYNQLGAAIGSHAVGMRREILPFLLDRAKRMELPYDIGPLSAATHAFPEQCFVIYPNIAIQSLDDSDIRSSEFQKTEGAKARATYRWRLGDYDEGAGAGLRALPARLGRPARRLARLRDRLRRA